VTGLKHPRKKRVAPGAAAELRRQAEERLDGLSAATTAASPVLEDAADLVQELRVHQIELEMQNEELRRAQLELEEQRAKYFELFDLAPVGYLTLCDKNIIRDANLTAALLLGVERQHLVAKPFSAFILADDQDVYYRQRKLMEQTGAPQTCELRLRRVGAEPFWAHLEWRPQRGPAGESPPYHLTFIDVHERVVVEEALQRSRHSLKAALDGLSASIAVLDDRGTILFVNKTWREFAEQNGLTADSVSEGTNYLQVCDGVAGEDSGEAARFAGGIRAVLSGETHSYVVEYPCHAPDKKRWFTGRVTVFPGEGSPRVIVAHEDISARKQAEEALDIASARLLERSRRGGRLNEALNEVGAKLNASFALDPALDDVLKTACAALECDTALLARASLGDWRVEHAFGVELPDAGLVFDQLLLKAMSPDAPLVFASSESPHEALLSTRLGLTEAIVAPVPAAREPGGALLFGRTNGERRFDDQAIDFVRRLAQSLALSLANAAQFEAEHHIAETLQEALLVMPASVRGLEFSHLYRSATSTTRVGGDFFDVFAMIAGRAGVLVGDVSGKGLKAAVLTSIIKDTIKAYAHATPSPAAAMARANVALGEAAEPPVFASVFSAVVDGRQHSLTYCNAGHPPAAVLAPDGSVRLLEGASPVIGAFPDVTYADRTVPLALDETVLLYTDGVTEARNPRGTFFEEEGLLAALKTADAADVAGLPAAVFDAVMTFTEGRQTDDIALLAFRHTGSPVPNAGDSA
jgi:PAS domain S-box-containing protein